MGHYKSNKHAHIYQLHLPPKENMGYIMMGVMMTIYCVYLIVIYITVNVFT